MPKAPASKLPRNPQTVTPVKMQSLFTPGSLADGRAPASREWREDVGAR